MRIRNLDIPNAISVDVEDWISATVLQVCRRIISPSDNVFRNTQRLLDIFLELEITGTWFLLGEVAEKFPNLVRQLAAAGQEIGIHGYHHHQIGDLTREAYRESIHRSKAIVEQTISQEVIGYRAVDFSISKDTIYALDVLIEEGFKYDSSIFPVKTPRYGIDKAELKPHWIDRDGGRIFEIPVTVANIAGLRIPGGGGGYFRLFPFIYSLLVGKLSLFQGRPVVYYLHPFEIDCTNGLEQLPRDLSFKNSTRIHWLHQMQSLNRKKTAAKLRKLTKKIPMGSMGDLYTRASKGVS